VKEVQEVLADHGYEWIRIPAHSADLNPMEHIWAQLKQKVGVTYWHIPFATIEELDRRTLEAWNKIDITGTMKGYVQTLRAVIDSKGEYQGD
jgi:hypothetical protein